MDKLKRQKLKKFIKELEGIRGRHTELVSVYIPAGYDLNKIISHLSEEQSTAMNIKDKTTRKNVMDSLERAIRHLRLFKQTPENGLAIFAGNASNRQGAQDIQVWSIEPAEPIGIRLYRCDQTFVLDYLKQFLEEKNVYGLIVLDRREGNIGILKGSVIREITSHTSAVPGKAKTGGQCLSPDTFIQSCDGEILKIKDSHNPYVLKSVDFNTNKLKDSPITSKWETKKNKLYKITTKFPRLQVESSKDHYFFVLEDEIKEKSAEELKEGDLLLMPEKIEIRPTQYFFDIAKYSNVRKSKVKTILPKKLDETFAQFLGYLMGDGCIERDRITFFEQRKELAWAYKEKFDKYFGLNSSYKFRKSKNYHQLRFTSRPLVRLVQSEFPKQGIIPLKIQKSNNQIVAAYLRGLFDAEGYISSKMAISMNNKQLLQQVQMLLLRFSIISSLLEYDNRRNPYSNKTRYTLEISEKQSLQLFKEYISFTAKDKVVLLTNMIKNKTEKSNVRQIAVQGSEIRKIIKKAGYNLELFPKVSGFFNNKRMMSKQAFKYSILTNVNDKRLYASLNEIYNYNILPVKIHKIEVSEKSSDFVDISVKNQNFIANGLIVHNSAQRFERIRNEMAKEFFKRVAGSANKEFLEMKGLKGIIIGGPTPTKEDFYDGNFLNNEVKKKVLGLKDLSYTGEFGLKELVDKSADLLKEETITEEKQIMDRFLQSLAKTPEKTAYGLAEVKRALDLAAVDVLLLSESLDDNLIEELEDKAEAVDSKVKIISLDTHEGMQLKELGGIGALLRFPLPMQ